MEDTGAGVVGERVPPVDDVDALGITPQAGAVVVVHLVPTERDVPALDDLGAAGVPVRVVAAVFRSN